MMEVLEYIVEDNAKAPLQAYVIQTTVNAVGGL